MIKPEQIPDEVLLAFLRAWSDQSTLSTKECLTEAINAWPDAAGAREAEQRNKRYIILPIQEKRDE